MKNDLNSTLESLPLESALEHLAVDVNEMDSAVMLQKKGQVQVVTVPCSQHAKSTRAGRSLFAEKAGQLIAISPKGVSTVPSLRIVPGLLLSRIVRQP